MIKRLLIIVVGIVLLGGSLAWWMGRDKGGPEGFRTSKVTRGDLVLNIAATGTLKPREEVDVGAQVAGQIASFGTDADGKTVDYGSRVLPGMVLANIDDAVYATDKKTAAAELEVAKAGVTSAERDLEQMKAKLYQAQRDWERAERLGPSDALAQAAYDQYKSTFEVAKANVGVADASILKAKAQVLQAEAALDRAERNLGFTVIKSPVEGIVVDRRVNIGQTVVASLNAPSLFLLATDLKKLKVWVSVNEADVARVKPGQPVTFTVDALPGEQFHGTVSRVRLNAQMTQNVVTYIVEVETNNDSMKLLPYQSASVRFEVDRRDDALLVPTAALRYEPRPELIAPEFRDAAASAAAQASAGPTAGAEHRGANGGGGGGGGGRRKREGGEASATGPTTAPAAPRLMPGTVWVADGKFVKPVKVRTGLSDGVQTEVAGESVTDGMEVVVGEILAQDASAAGANANPFGPPQWGRRSGQGGQGGRGAGGGGGGARGGGGGGR